MSAPESWEPVVLTQQRYNFPSQGAFRGGFHRYIGTGEALHVTAAAYPESGYTERGNWFHQITELKIPFWEYK